MFNGPSQLFHTKAARRGGRQHKAPMLGLARDTFTHAVLLRGIKQLSMAFHVPLKGCVTWWTDPYSRMRHAFGLVLVSPLLSVILIFALLVIHAQLSILSSANQISLK